MSRTQLNIIIGLSVGLLYACDPSQENDQGDASTQTTEDLSAAPAVPAQDMTPSLDSAATQLDATTPRPTDVGVLSSSDEGTTPAIDARATIPSTSLDRGGGAGPSVDAAAILTDMSPSILRDAEADPNLDMRSPAPLDQGLARPADSGLLVDAAPIAPPDQGGRVQDTDAGGPAVDRPRCEGEQWYCERSDHCIPTRYLCDGSDDCEPFGEDDTPEVCVPGVIPDRCLADSQWQDDPQYCYTGCWDGQGCPDGHLCVRSLVGEICVADCRILGCPEHLVCGGDGYCTVDPAQLLIGAPCTSPNDCGADRLCGDWVDIPGDDINDPPLTVWLDIGSLKQMDPDAIGHCQGRCEECTAPGTTWCMQGSCGPCAMFEDHPPESQGRCELSQSTCWRGACDCLDTQRGTCLVPPR